MSDFGVDRIGIIGLNIQHEFIRRVAVLAHRQHAAITEGRGLPQVFGRGRERIPFLDVECTVIVIEMKSIFGGNAVFVGIQGYDVQVSGGQIKLLYNYRLIALTTVLVISDSKAITSI